LIFRVNDRSLLYCMGHRFCEESFNKLIIPVLLIWQPKILNKGRVMKATGLYNQGFINVIPRVAPGSIPYRTRVVKQKLL
jgi:hypothetical protein